MRQKRDKLSKHKKERIKRLLSLSISACMPDRELNNGMASFKGLVCFVNFKMALEEKSKTVRQYIVTRLMAPFKQKQQQ